MDSATLVASKRTLITVRGAQRSGSFLLDDSAGIGELVYIAGPDALVGLTKNASLYVSQMGLANSAQLSAVDSFIFLINNGSLSLQANSSCSLAFSVLYVSGAGMGILDSSVAATGSAITMDLYSDLSLICTLATEPEVAGNIRRQCEIGMYTSAFNVQGSVVINGRYARVSLSSSRGVIGSVRSSSGNFILGNGATFYCSQSEVLLSGNFILSNQSTFQGYRSVVGMAASLYLDISSTFILYDQTNVTVLQNVVLFRGSAIGVTSGSRLVIASAISADSSYLYAQNGGEYVLAGGVVALVNNSVMRLDPGGSLLGAGSINGTLVNNGGTVRSSGNNRTEINVGHYNSSSNSNSTIATNVGQTSGGNLTSSTVIVSGTAVVGGTIIITVSPTLNQQLYLNITGTPDGGIVLISAQNLTGETPTLVVHTSDGRDAPISTDPNTGCGYRLVKSTTTLAVVFDTVGCPTLSPDGAPALLTVDPASNLSAVPIWIIAVASVCGVIGLALVVAAVVWFVPPLKRRFIPGAAIKYSRDIKHRAAVQSKPL